MPATDITGVTALVTGASRGFGRGIATSLSRAGARVIGVARDHEQLQRLRTELGGSFIPVIADAAAPVTAGQLIDAYRPAILVLNAGAAPARPPDSPPYLADLQPELGRGRAARVPLGP